MTEQRRNEIGFLLDLAETHSKSSKPSPSHRVVRAAKNIAHAQEELVIAEQEAMEAAKDASEYVGSELQANAPSQDELFQYIKALISLMAVAPDNPRNLLIMDQKFTPRVRNILTDDLKLKTLGDLADRSEDDLHYARYFGKSSLREVKDKLKSYGLALKEPPVPSSQEQL
jgi:DNA-directed RNA polymerase alpha subunit